MKLLLKSTFTFGIASLMLLSCQKVQQQTSLATTPQNAAMALNAVNYASLIAEQCTYIRSCQRSSGAIMNDSGVGNDITPYFSNIACLGLLEDPTSTNIASVKSWMTWYMSHLNGTTNPSPPSGWSSTETAGSVYDYTTTSTTETAKYKYDSIDSYAATFLSLAKKFYEVASAGDKTWLAGKATELNLIGSALMSCIDNSANTMPAGGFDDDDNDGLSIDSYNHKCKYTMDNTEVNAGLKAMSWLQTNALSGSAAAWNTAVTNNTNGIESQLWRSTMYNPYDNNNTNLFASWGTWYADATCQLFPAMLDVISVTASTRATDLYNTFNTNYPAWVNNPYAYTTHPWAVVSFAAAKVGDYPGANTYLSWVDSYAGTTNPPYWYTAEAGWAIRTAKYLSGVNNTNYALGGTATTSSTNGVSPGAAVDGDSATTRWSSDIANNEWWKVDLGSNQSISRIIIRWEGAYATAYTIQTSTDNISFTNALPQITGANGGNDLVAFAPVTARYIKIICNTRINSLWGSSFWEFEAY